MPKEHEDSSNETRLSRRELLQRSAALGAAISVPALIAACGGGGEESAGTQGTTTPSTPTTATTTAATTGGETTEAGAPTRGGRLRVGLNDGGATDTLSPWNIPSY